MRLTDDQIKELNALIKKGKLDLPFNKKLVEKHTGVYGWLQKNICVRNSSKITPRLAELLDIKYEKPKTNTENLKVKNDK